MTNEEFRAIEAAIAEGHADMAARLGISEVSVKRYATGSQLVPEHIAKLTVALLLVQREGLQKKFSALLDRYHSDTNNEAIEHKYGKNGGMTTLVEMTRALALKCSKLNGFAWAEALNQAAHFPRYSGMNHEMIVALWEQHLEAGTLTIDVNRPPMVFIP